MKLIGSFSLSNSEIEILAETLNELQRHRLSKFAKNKLSNVDILALISKLSEGQVRQALKDLKTVLDEKTEDKE